MLERSAVVMITALLAGGCRAIFQLGRGWMMFGLGAVVVVLLFAFVMTRIFK